VPVDQTNPRTQFQQVYALGDDFAASIAGGEPPAPYGGSGVCYAEFGDGLVSKVELNFLSGPAAAQRYDASREYAAEQEEFGATRRARWFGP
jgi:sulfide:quinone oxidoreductase